MASSSLHADFEGAGAKLGGAVPASDGAAPPPSAPPLTGRLTGPQRSGMRHFLRQGVPSIWLSGAMVLGILAMLASMITLVLCKGLGHFWPPHVVQVDTATGAYLGPVMSEEKDRLLLKIGNRDLYGLDFRWISFSDIRKRGQPSDAIVLERREYGDFHGYLRELRRGEQVTARGPEAWTALHGEMRAAGDEASRLRELEKRIESAHGSDAALEGQRDALAEELGSRVAVLQSADGREKSVRLDGIVRAYRPNSMHVGQRLAQYGSKLGEFLFGQPRESNTEGGIFPALYGTLLMVLLMTVAVVPLGVIAALYLHEYAKQGPVLRAVRLAVSNLAGVPSIVFGMFGLAFFVYGVGGAIDHGFFSSRLPNPTFGTGGILWASMTLALLTLPVVIVSTVEGLSSVPRANREGSLALGATQWQTLWHVVLPSAAPGILTGLILAVSRGAGEVAPLMLTGVVKLAPALPLDGSFPFLHLERKFMHLGFHIYDVSMQSPNVEAAKPMVYSTTLLLLVLVVALNTTAIVLRNNLRRRYRGSAL